MNNNFFYFKGTNFESRVNELLASKWFCKFKDGNRLEDKSPPQFYRDRNFKKRPICPCVNFELGIGLSKAQ